MPLTAGTAAAPQRLAVDRDSPQACYRRDVRAGHHPSGKYGVQRVGVEAGQDPADRGRIGDQEHSGEPVPGHVQPGHHRDRQVRRPLTGGRHRTLPGSDRAHRDREQAGQ
jgi:hypothetical protein